MKYDQGHYIIYKYFVVFCLFVSCLFCFFVCLFSFFFFFFFFLSHNHDLLEREKKFIFAFFELLSPCGKEFIKGSTPGGNLKLYKVSYHRMGGRQKQTMNHSPTLPSYLSLSLAFFSPLLPPPLPLQRFPLICYQSDFDISRN